MLGATSPVGADDSLQPYLLRFLFEVDFDCHPSFFLALNNDSLFISRLVLTRFDCAQGSPFPPFPPLPLPLRLLVFKGNEGEGGLLIIGTFEL